MKFLELVKKRQSVRRYSSRKVEDEKIINCLEAARLAPSASNSQPWSYILVTEPEIRDRVARATFDNVLSFNKFVVQAPVLAVLIIEKPKVVTRIGGAVKKREFPLIDIGISAEHFCLQATEEGLGTCMIGWFNEQKVKKYLNIPSSKRVGLIITMGYPVENYKVREKSRKPFEEIIYYNSYGSSKQNN